MKRRSLPLRTPVSPRPILHERTGLEVDQSAAGDVVRAVVEIAAPPEEVFHAITDPHELAAWLGGGPNDESATAPAPWQAPAPTASVVPGQPWRTPALAPDGTIGSVGGEYLLVNPPRRLESTWRASWDDFAPSTVRFDLVPVDVDGAPGTRLTVTHTRPGGRFVMMSGAGVRGAPTTRDWLVWLTRLAAHFTEILV